jgi:hypothetical protein
MSDPLLPSGMAEFANGNPDLLAEVRAGYTGLAFDEAGNPLVRRGAVNKQIALFDDLIPGPPGQDGGAVNVTDVSGFDATALHVALQSALNDNALVIVPPGNYTIGVKVTIPNNTTLWIMPGATITAANAFNGVMFENSDTVNGNFGCRIFVDGVIDGNRANQSDSNTHRAIRFLRANQSIIAGSGRIVEVMGTAVELNTSSFSRIDGLRIYGHNGVFSNGISFQICTDCILSNLLIRDCVASNSGSGYGIYSAGGLNLATPTHRRNRIERCHAIGCSNDNLVLFDQDGTYVADCRFDLSTADKGCHASNLRDARIVRTSFSGNFLGGMLHGVTGGVVPGPVLFEDCEFSRNGAEGIYINSSSTEVSRCKIHRNTGRGLRTFFANPVGLHIHDCTISDNSSAAANLPGMELASTTFSIIERNVFTDTQATKTQTYGIVEAATSSNNLYRGNVITPHEVGYKNLLGSGSTYAADNVEL